MLTAAAITAIVVILNAAVMARLYSNYRAETKTRVAEVAHLEALYALPAAH